MPLRLLRQDITKMKCDAIVNPTNVELRPTGGLDLAIHKASGDGLLGACKSIGHIKVGQAVVTPAFNLKAKYVIHTAGPVWRGGDNGEEAQLKACYQNCLALARENSLNSIAFPLISSGTYGYPKDKVLKTAVEAISEFLLSCDMTVSLVVFDKTAYELSTKLFSSIKSYIDDNYVSVHSTRLNSERSRRRYDCNDCAPCCSAPIPVKAFDRQKSAEESLSVGYAKELSLDDYIKLDESFAIKLLKLIDAKGMTDVECYKKANVSKQTWYKLMNDKFYKPNKKTAISFAVALKLSLEETQNLLKSVGFILSNSSLFDVIIMYCLENKIYNVLEIDSILFKYDQETLYSKI